MDTFVIAGGGTGEERPRRIGDSDGVERRQAILC
jgi:hypothetical protein